MNKIDDLAIISQQIIPPAIVIAAYNRPPSLERVLYSINNGIYYGENVPLVISIDYQNSENHAEVVKIAHNFQWQYGEKKIIEHKENLGLRNHIISCGNLTKEYNSIIMLEDDIYVSPQFYAYTIQMLKAYALDERIAGISLYKFVWNQTAYRPFSPEPSDSDVFFIQYAQSWGQCWTFNMWSLFYEWYYNNSSIEFSEKIIPPNVINWPESSWLKYFIKYVVETNKYFVYPYESLSTNFGDAGTHNLLKQNNNVQVSLLLNYKKYNIPKFGHIIKYDAFFERVGLEIYLDLQNVCIDLYGYKKNKQGNRYWLTAEVLPYKIIESFGLNFRPHEMNVILKNRGSDIFLYDTKFPENNRIKKNKIAIFRYDYSFVRYDEIVKYLFNKVIYEFYNKFFLFYDKVLRTVKSYFD